MRLVESGFSTEDPHRAAALTACGFPLRHADIIRRGEEEKVVFDFASRTAQGVKLRAVLAVLDSEDGGASAVDEMLKRAGVTPEEEAIIGAHFCAVARKNYVQLSEAVSEINPLNVREINGQILAWRDGTTQVDLEKLYNA